MRKKLLSGVILFLLLNLLIKPFWILGIDVEVQNRVGASEYGLYFSIFSFAYLFNILLDLGVTNFNNRNIAQYNHLLSKHLPAILNIKLLLFAFFLIVTFGVGLAIGYDSRQFYLLAWMCLNQFLNSLILYLRSNFSGLLMFKLDSFLSVMDKILMVAFCSVLLWGDVLEGNFRIEYFIYAQTLAYVITALTALVILVNKTGIHGLKWNAPLSLMIIKKSLPFALLALLMSCYNRLDPIMLERLLPGNSGSFQAGIYASAFRLLDALVMLAYLVSVPLLPIYSKMIKEKQDISQITKLIFTLVFTVSSAVAITFSFMSTDLMALFYDEHVTESAEVFRLLIFCLVPISMGYVFGTLLTANGDLKKLNIVAGCSLLLNLLTNIILIPRLMSKGSAMAALSTQIFSAVVQVILAIRIFKLRISPKFLLQISAFLILIVAANVAISRLQITWWVGIIIVAVLSTAVAFLFRLLDFKELVTIFKEK